MALSKDDWFHVDIYYLSQVPSSSWIPVLLWGGLLYAVIFESFNETFPRWADRNNHPVTNDVKSGTVRVGF